MLAWQMWQLVQMTMAIMGLPYSGQKQQGQHAERMQRAWVCAGEQLGAQGCACRAPACPITLPWSGHAMDMHVRA